MSQLALVPARGAALTILTNGARLKAALTEWLVAEWLRLPSRPTPVPLVPQPALAPFVGRYWAPLSDITIATEGDAFVLRVAWKGSVAERPRRPRRVWCSADQNGRRDRGRPTADGRFHA